ncbi:hypothetical protein LGZ99_17370 [Photorhabdus temperata]|uniref:Uncharacterized protein n=1 Tax=Photorhabdus temperata subsp. temperata Meg1 TaxID=1393735 RepID=A0A081RW02_PHOTE|nr:hypothetical protein [Photorhabdus temperata]KER02855.1 hypothetical protein MEG1DRAFT_02584 [Photorhabdus temperata subsp. temperata Meg1]MCT8348908.1 hypothetical protein [Photorhabdus temperata]
MSKPFTVDTLISRLQQLSKNGKGNYIVDIPDEYNGGWMEVKERNIVINDKHKTVFLDFSKDYPGEYGKSWWDK